MQRYKVCGIDITYKTIKRLKKYIPELPVAGGDVTKPPFPDNCFASYLSFGVIEHYENRPHELLREAHRALHSRGKLIVSVSFMSLARRIILRISQKRTKYIKNSSVCLQFYQYVFF